MEVDITGLVLEFEVNREANFRYDKERTKDCETKKLWTLHKDLEHRMVRRRFSFEIVSLCLPAEDSPLKGVQIGKRSTDLGIWTGQRTLEALELQQNVIPESLRGFVILGPGVTWKCDGKSYMAVLCFAEDRWAVGWRQFSFPIDATELFLKPMEK